MNEREKQIWQFSVWCSSQQAASLIEAVTQSSLYDLGPQHNKLVQFDPVVDN